MESSTRAEGLIIRAASKEKLSQYSAAPVSQYSARLSPRAPVSINRSS